MSFVEVRFEAPLNGMPSVALALIERTFQGISHHGKSAMCNVGREGF